MLRVRVHGRGGEGAVTFAHILCASATFAGKFGQSCMSPAIERRGAPVEAYARIGDTRIAERGVMLNPDFVVVLNPSLAKAVNVKAGMNPDGKLLVNSAKDLDLGANAIYIDATSIALKTIKVPITNTTMLGAFAAVTGLVTVDSLLEGAELILSRLSKDKLKANVDAIKAGFEEMKAGMRR